MGFSPQSSFDLSGFCTFGIGGLARWYCTIESVEVLQLALSWARQAGVRTLFVGEGSNILFSDQGFEGLILINRLPGMSLLESSEREGRSEVLVEAGSGVNLLELIRWCNERGLSGLEKMYGIPGSVGGALVGNAGAYGQEISDVLVRARVFTGSDVRTLDRTELSFRYRHSILKERPDWFLTGCVLRLERRDGNLQAVSDQILQLREVKYPPGLRCPGSFFKNVEAARLPRVLLDQVAAEFMTHGKIPAGRLLQEVGACGAREGQAMIASYHGNLFVNLGGASSADVLRLAERYAARVKQRFGISLEPEVLVVPFRTAQDLQPADPLPS